MTNGYRGKCLGLCAIRRGMPVDPGELVGGVQESAVFQACKRGLEPLLAEAPIPQLQ